MNAKLEDTPLEIAESTLLDASDAVRRRLEQHGHTERSFKMIAELWSVYISHTFTSRDDFNLKPHDVAHMMGLVKTARTVYGYSVDNFTDGAGYNALAAMLTPSPAKPANKQPAVSDSRFKPDLKLEDDNA